MIRRKWKSGAVVIGVAVSLAVAVATAAALSGESEIPAAVHSQAALGTGFTYQGRLDRSGEPVNDDCSMEFRLYDAASDGSELASAITLTVPITEGLFTVDLDFGGGAFDGESSWLGIRVLCPGDGVYADLGRQELTASPYALYAASAGALQGNPVTTTVPAVGQVLEWDGGEWVPGEDDDSTSFWSLTGNSGTDPSTDYLGTTDGVSLTLAVSGTAVLRLEPDATSPNIIGGHGGNSVTDGARGATIGGGGADGVVNRVTDSYGTVSGGQNNRAGDNTGTTSDKAHASVGGGENNVASGSYATVGGGADNTASGYAAIIGGGASNTVGGDNATVGGGNTNSASSDFATVSGGRNNTASNGDATVGGGRNNTASNAYATVNGGYSNATSGYGAAIGGGANNTANTNYATIPGGYQASATKYGQLAYASGRFSVQGDAQTAVYVLRNDTVYVDTTTELFLDGVSQRLTLNPDQTIVFDILIAARSTTNTSAGYSVRGVIRNSNGNTQIVGSPVVVEMGEENAAWGVSVTADNDNDALAIWVTGTDTYNIHWVATVRTVEVMN